VTEPSKYDELRLKTDSQLIQIANTEVDLGIRAAHAALESAENWRSAERHYLVAEGAYAQASRLIRLADDICADERRGVEFGLSRLREVLEGLSVLDSTTPAGDKTECVRSYGRD